MIYKHTNAVVPSFADKILYRFVIYEQPRGTGVGVKPSLTCPEISMKWRCMFARWGCRISLRIVPKVLTRRVARAAFARRKGHSCRPERGILHRLTSWQVDDEVTEIGWAAEATSHSI